MHIVRSSKKVNRRDLKMVDGAPLMMYIVPKLHVLLYRFTRPKVEELIVVQFSSNYGRSRRSRDIVKISYHCLAISDLERLFASTLSFHCGVLQCRRARLTSAQTVILPATAQGRVVVSPPPSPHLNTVPHKQPNLCIMTVFRLTLVSSQP